MLEESRCEDYNLDEDSLAVKCVRPALSRRSSISLVLTLFSGSMLNRRVPANKVGSYGMIVTFRLSYSRDDSQILWSSIRI